LRSADLALPNIRPPRVCRCWSRNGHVHGELAFRSCGAPAAALPTQLWEALLSGAMGVHIFTRNERIYSLNYFPAKRGSGRNRPGGSESRLFQRSRDFPPHGANPHWDCCGTTNPPADINFLSRNADMVGPGPTTRTFASGAPSNGWATSRKSSTTKNLRAVPGRTRRRCSCRAHIRWIQCIWTPSSAT
jgi:hypothetical protein